ncbi:MAG: ABC transporter substrate-binding protein, partial [Flavobacteriaceae bacterium]|nr:ABC transporter substrate-binding protein [Flavobacteriaceae bacterium]
MKQQVLLILLAISLVIACKKENEEGVKMEQKSNIKYAKGFDIQHFENYSKLIIKSPYPNATEFQEFYFMRTNEISQEGPKSEMVSEIPSKKIFKDIISRIVVTSTTHIPMLELLGEETSLVGFPNLKYISSEKTNQRIKEEKIIELGKEESINTEVVLELRPDAVIGFALNSNNKMFTTIEKAGIPVLLNGDWLEETPLGRAEWIKFFGILFDKEKEADSLFNTIEKDYLEAKAMAKQATKKPTVLSGIQFNQIWNVPAG